MKTLDWSVETLGLDYNSTGLCNHLFKPEYIASETYVGLFLIWSSVHGQLNNIPIIINPLSVNAPYSIIILHFYSI